jgi:dTDP-4-dehydrorhamnose reductase
MKVLLTGGRGQLGQALQTCLPANIELFAPDRSVLDITEPARLEWWLSEHRPDLVINCAAYTQVDHAESDPQAAEATNHTAVRGLAELAAQMEMRVLHISTDYVFDGRSNRPYPVTANGAPETVYGATKLRGEQALLLALPGRATVVRTSWLYAAVGNNFLLTMLRLMASRSDLAVVMDQVGTPTHCLGLAKFLWWAALEPTLPPVLHWADAGVASWYDFATAIAEEAGRLGLLTGSTALRPIPSDDYPQAAPRPAYSVLDTSISYQLSALAPLHWREGLRKTLVQYQLSLQE